jgi:hypothetical protein
MLIPSNASRKIEVLTTRSHGRHRCRTHCPLPRRRSVHRPPPRPRQARFAEGGRRPLESEQVRYDAGRIPRHAGGSSTAAAHASCFPKGSRQPEIEFIGWPSREPSESAQRLGFGSEATSRVRGQPAAPPSTARSPLPRPCPPRRRSFATPLRCASRQPLLRVCSPSHSTRPCARAGAFVLCPPPPPPFARGSGSSGRRPGWPASGAGAGTQRLRDPCSGVQGPAPSCAGGERTWQQRSSKSAAVTTTSTSSSGGGNA